MKRLYSGARATHVRMVEPVLSQGLILGVTAPPNTQESFVMLSAYRAQLPKIFLVQDLFAKMEGLAMILMEYSLVPALQVTQVASVKGTFMNVILVHVKTEQLAKIK